jgi:hypothetical protein
VSWLIWLQLWDYYDNYKYLIILQAIRKNMADVSAKDGSQETFVNLCASFVGIIILSMLGEGE